MKQYDLYEPIIIWCTRFIAGAYISLFDIMHCVCLHIVVYRRNTEVRVLHVGFTGCCGWVFFIFLLFFNLYTTNLSYVINVERKKISAFFSSSATIFFSSSFIYFHNFDGIFFLFNKKEELSH